jgi:acyl-CoA synthetase (AMP-forming)/AMP-acid ligase II
MAQRVRDSDLDEVDLSSLRGLVNCSEPVTKESQDRFGARFADNGLRSDVFWGCYAMAETTFALTHGRCTDAGYLSHHQLPNAATRDEASPYVSMGQPLPGVKLRVADKRGRPLPEGRVGELLVKSPFNLEGYYKNSAATADAFVDGWYRTGDLGFQTDTEFYVCGRSKDLLIVGGVNVHPQDVEEMVSLVPGVIPGRVTVISSFDARAQTERIVVLAESTVDNAEQMAIVLTIRQRILACFQIANFDVQLVSAGWLIKSSSGKMARGANREKWHDAA